MKKRSPGHRQVPWRVDNQDSHGGCRRPNPVIFSLSAGQAHDTPEGRKLLERPGPQPGSPSMVMDRAYAGDATRQLASGLGYSVIVPPRRSRKVACEYDEDLYKRRNEVERLFRRMKGLRRIFTWYEKLDELYIGFILFGTIFDALRSVNRPWADLSVTRGYVRFNAWCQSHCYSTA